MKTINKGTLSGWKMRNGKIQDFIEKLCRYGIWMAGTVTVLYLWMLSMFSSTHVELRNFAGPNEAADIDEYAFFIGDRVLIHIIALTGMLFLCYAVKRSRLVQRCPNFMHTTFILFAVWFLAALAFILALRLQPVSDPGKVLRIAHQFREGDFSSMETEGYLFRHNHQAGIVLYCWVFSCIFGAYDYLAIQIVNVGMTLAIFHLMGRIAGLLWEEGQVRISSATKLLFLLFLPAFFYTTFVYGTIPSFLGSTAAFYFELKFFRDRKWTDILFGSLCMGLAIVLKSNSLILCVAMAIFLIYDIVVANKKMLSALFLALLWIMQAGCLQITHMAIENITGIPVSEGMPKLTYVAMSLQESRFAPGTWNGHSVQLFEEAGYDRDRTNELALDSIRRSMEKFSEDKSEAVRWLGRKLAGEWNEPDFGSIRIMKGRPSDRPFPEAFESLLNGRLKYAVTAYLNILQSLILAGTLLYLLLGVRRIKTVELLLLTGFIGGFLFHIAWEAKAQYTVPYFMLLFGYSVRGYAMAADGVEALVSGRIGKKKLLGAAAVLVCFIFLTAGLYQTRLFQYLIHVQDSEELCGLYESAVEQNIEEDSVR